MEKGKQAGKPPQEKQPNVRKVNGFLVYMDE
jgi:hypothetical protein